KSTFPDGAKYFVLEGPAGVSVVNERNEGWNQTMEGESAFTNLGSQTANWSTQEAKSVFETVLKSNGNDVQLVFAQNDEMGLGAAQAVQEAGLTPGEDVKIATIDGTQAALEALADGTLSFVAEYNPLFGEQAAEAACLTPGAHVNIAPTDRTHAALEALADGTLSFVAEYNPLCGEQALEAVDTVLDGGEVEPYIQIESTTFDSPEAAEEALPDRKYRAPAHRPRHRPGRGDAPRPGPRRRTDPPPPRSTAPCPAGRPAASARRPLHRRSKTER